MARIDPRTVMLFVLLGLGFFLLSGLVHGGAGSGPALLLRLLYFAIAFLIAIDVHEFGHAYVSDLLGDRTARAQGRVTLNPISHLDPFGTLMILMTALSGIGIGWGKPVQVNPSRIASGRNGMALVSIAGVMANLLTAVVTAFILRLGILPHLGGAFSLDTLFATIATINILLAVFNFLVPLPPLDGFNFLVNVLPLRWAWQFRQLERFGPMLLLLLILGSQMHILFFNPLQYLVGVPMAWLSGALGLA